MGVTPDNSAVLATLYRDDVPEVQIRGFFSVRHGEEKLVALGDLARTFPTRSVLKPFQYLAGYSSTYPDRVPERWVPALGSPSAIPPQVRCFDRWFEEEAARERWEKSLLLRPTFPIDPNYRGHVKYQGEEPRLRWHDCYTKHLAIVAACERHGWDEATYLSQEHPFHRRLCGVLGELLDRTPESFRFVGDGCGLPTPLLTPLEMARLYRGLVQSENAQFRNVVDAFGAYPDWIGGPGRLDSEVLRRLRSRAVAKEGADGLFAMGFGPTTNFPNGGDIVLKLESGMSAVHARTVLSPVLERLGVDVGDSVVRPSEHHRIQWNFSL